MMTVIRVAVINNSPSVFIEASSGYVPIQWTMVPSNPEEVAVVVPEYRKLERNVGSDEACRKSYALGKR